jgi:GntR family transcriptional regulator
MVGAPLYAQTAKALRTRVGTEWRVGDRIPAEPRLCEEFGVSSITMRRAVATLVAEGLLVRLQGRGTFVAADRSIVQGPPRLTSFTQDMQSRGWTSAARVIGVRTGRVPADVCLQLGVGESSVVTAIERVRLADGEPVALQVAYLPAINFPGLEGYDFGRESLYEVLNQHYNVQPAAATETYRASTAGPEEAKQLEVPAGSAVFRAERVTVDGTGHKIEYVRSVIRGDRYSLQLRLAAIGKPDT